MIDVSTRARHVLKYNQRPIYWLLQKIAKGQKAVPFTKRAKEEMCTARERQAAQEGVA